MILNFKSGKQTSNTASVVDGKLILSMPDAITPVVWQMDLAQAKASALEVLHNEDKNTFTLSVKTAKGETIEVANFNTRAEAVEGLMAASTALENAHGHIRSSADLTSSTTSVANDGKVKKAKKPKTPLHKKQLRNHWMAAVLAIIILFILLTIWSNIVPHKITTAGPEQTAAAIEEGEINGVPLSADDFLSGQ